MSTDSNNQSDKLIKEHPTQPIKCLSPDCNFYGNPATENYCSSCYKKVLSTRPQASPASAMPEQANTSQEESPESLQKNKGRCYLCNKKVGLLGFKCKCGFIFCGTHRYADQHSCSFDYKKQNKDILVKANPVIEAVKVESI